MDDRQIREAMELLLAEEHELRTLHQRGPIDGTDAVRLRELAEALDQSWDLLRQRRARREFGLDPENVGVRDVETISHYRQ